MAALEKIRSKSVFLIVVIGVALFAFIIGDFLNSGQTFFGNTMTVAKVGGEKISIQDFQKKYEQMSEQVQNSGQQVDPALIQQRTLDNMIEESLLESEVEELGIVVTDEEITEFMTGRFAGQQMYQMAQQVGAPDVKSLHDMLFNPGKYGLTNEAVAPIRTQWIEIEKQTEQRIKYMKLGNLLSGAIQANALDIKELNGENSTSKVMLVKKDFSSINNDDIKVSPEEIKARYAEEKNKFRTSQPTRRIHYITVDVRPSADDEAAAARFVNSADSALRNVQGIDGVASNPDLFVKTTKNRLNDITNPAIKDFASKSNVGAVSEMKHIGDTYSMAKLLAKSQEVDSVKLDIVTLQGDKTLQDSVLNMLNSGKTIAEVAKVKGIVDTQEAQWIDMLAVNFDAEGKGKLLAADSKYFSFQSNDQSAVIVKVIEKKAPKTVYEVAEVSYKVIPSENTVRELRGALNTFVANNQDSKSFTENAIKSNYSAIETMLTSNMPQIDGIPYTRKAIQWVFNAKEGEVSPIFDKENNDKLVVVALDEINDSDFAPVSDQNVSMLLTTLIRNDKKGEQLVAEFAGKAKDLNGYAAAMDSKVDSTNCTFSQGYIPAAGYEPALVGSISAAKPGQLYGPVKGMSGVYVYQVAEVDENGPKLSNEEAGNRYTALHGGQAVLQRLIDILRQNNEVEYMIEKFY